MSEPYASSLGGAARAHCIFFADRVAPDILIFKHLLVVLLGLSSRTSHCRRALSLAHFGVMTDMDVPLIAPDQDRIHPPGPLQFTIVFSLDQSIDDREARVEDTFEHLGLRRKQLVDILYAVKVPLSQLLCPPIAHLHRSLIDYNEEIDPEGRYFFVIFSRRVFDLIQDSTAGSDMTIDLVQDGSDPELTRHVPLTIEMYPATDLVDIFGRLFDQVQRQEERLGRLQEEHSRLRNRIGLVTEYLATQDEHAARTFGLLLHG